MPVNCDWRLTATGADGAWRSARRGSVADARALQTVAKTIHIALAPVAALVWGYDTIKEFVSTRVAEKLAGVPAENIRTPEPHVVGPALEALRYTGHQGTLREL